MPRDPRVRKPRQKPGTDAYGPEWRERVSSGLRRFNAQRRARGAVMDADLRALVRGEAECRPALRPYLRAGIAEAQAVIEALGGPEALSPQRQALARDLARLSAVAGALTAAFFRTEDPELVPKLTSTIQARRTLLERLGLDWRREEHDLGQYLASRDREPAREPAQAPPGRTIDVVPDPAPAPAADTSASASAEREGHAETVAADEEPAP